MKRVTDKCFSFEYFHVWVQNRESAELDARGSRPCRRPSAGGRGKIRDHRGPDHLFIFPMTK